MGPFTTKERKGKVIFHEPHLPDESDDFIIRYVVSFWTKSYITLPLIGLGLIGLGCAFHSFVIALLNMAMVAKSPVSVSVLIFLFGGIAVCICIGILFLLKGVENYWYDHGFR